jgi:hypothetical protein
VSRRPQRRVRANRSVSTARASSPLANNPARQIRRPVLDGELLVYGVLKQLANLAQSAVVRSGQEGDDRAEFGRTTCRGAVIDPRLLVQILLPILLVGGPPSARRRASRILLLNSTVTGSPSSPSSGSKTNKSCRGGRPVSRIGRHGKPTTSRSLKTVHTTHRQAANAGPSGITPDAVMRCVRRHVELQLMRYGSMSDDP